MYSKLIDDDTLNYEELHHRPDVGHRAPTTSPVRPSPVRPSGPSGPSGPGLYRLATIGLAALCAILLIAIISTSAHYQNQAKAGGDAAGAESHTQEVNGTALMDAINRLREENGKLEREKDQLLAKLCPTTVPAVTKPAERSAPPPVVCPVDWHLFNNSCYFVSRTTRDWPESKSYCESQGAHLAIILSAEEQEFVWGLLPRGHWNAFWFGITDEHTEDQWKWVDGTAVVGGFWEEGEPNNHIDEDCGYIVKTRVLERVAVRSWYDAPCSMYWRFVCEKDVGAGASTAIPH